MYASPTFFFYNILGVFIAKEEKIKVLSFLRNRCTPYCLLGLKKCSSVSSFYGFWEFGRENSFWTCTILPGALGAQLSTACAEVKTGCTYRSQFKPRTIVEHSLKSLLICQQVTVNMYWMIKYINIINDCVLGFPSKLVSKMSKALEQRLLIHI